MLNDKQRRACIDASGHPEGEISQDEFDAFAAGIAYAQTQQAAMIAQARADALEEAAVHLENQYGKQFVARIVAAIRARKDGQ